MCRRNWGLIIFSHIRYIEPVSILNTCIPDQIFSNRVREESTGFLGHEHDLKIKIENSKKHEFSTSPLHVLHCASTAVVLNDQVAVLHI